MFRDYQNYEVYEDGRIWSKKRNKFLKPATERDGYQRVGLVDNNGKLHMQYVHRACWIAVKGEIPEGMQLNHIDENKCNNAIWNLELVTPKENTNFGTRNERASKALTNHPNKSKRVGAYDKNGELVMIFASTMEAQRNGYHQGNVSACCRGERKSHKGFEWKYLE